MSLPKHHFVPWSYLRYFAIDPKSKREDSRIHIWDKKIPKGFPKRTEKAQCYVHGQNTINNLSDPEFFEIQYIDIDGAFGTIIRMLLDTIRNSPTNAAFNSKNKDLLASHIMLMFKRQPDVFNNNMVKTNETIDAAKKIFSSEYKDGLLRSILERVLAEKSTKQYTLEISMKPIKEEVNALTNKVWIYCRNETDIPFVTSDFPLCPQLISSYNGGGMSDPGCILFFPIAPDALIYMIDPVHFSKNQKEYFDNVIEPIQNRDFVLIANNLQYKNCSRQIYSNQELSPEFYAHSDEITTSEL